jgi:capsid protein
MEILQKENKYEFAALINALQGACRGIFYEKDFPAELSADEMDDLTDQDEGGIAGGLEPGMSVELPYGLKAKVIESQYPTGDLGPFVKTMLRAASAAVGQSYTGMTGDLSEANFSSLRAGLDGERANWMMIQSFFIRNWKRKERSEWLYRMLLSQRIPLPLGKLAKYDVAEFTGRRWTGVNPLQDSQTNAQRLNNRECSIFQIIREQNQRDPEEVLREIKESEDMMKGLGIARITGQPQQADPEAAQKADDELAKKNAGKVDKEDESK